MTENTPRLLVYVMKNDSGKAPNIKNGICVLSKKCKGKTIVKSAKIGDWIIGIGGKILSEGKYYRKLIYAMKVEEENPPRSRKRNFTHYGNKAIYLPKNLKVIIKVPRKQMPRTKYFREKEFKGLYKKFDKFMATQQKKGKKGQIGEYCSNSNKLYKYESNLQSCQKNH